MVSSSISARFLYGFPYRFQRAWTVLCSMKHPLDVVRVGAWNSLLPGVVVMKEPSSVHLGPSGSVPATTSMISQGPQLLPSSVKDPLCSSSTPCGAVWEFPAADMPFAACTGGLSAVSHAEHRGSDLVHVWWRDRACRHFLSLFRHLMPALG